MNNVLVIGCSHLSGAYDKNDRIASNNSYGWWLWDLYGGKDRFVTMPNPAQGILKYAAIIEHLDVRGMLEDFTHCIIQLTQEPRTVFMDEREDRIYDALREMFDSQERFVDGRQIQIKNSAPYIRLSNVHRFLYEQYQEDFYQEDRRFYGYLNCDHDMRDQLLNATEQMSRVLDQSRSARVILPMAYSYIMQTLKRNNVKTAVFDWWGKEGTQWRSIRQVDTGEFLFDLEQKEKSIKEVMESRGEWFNRSELTNLEHLNSSQAWGVATVLKEYLDERQFFE